MKTPTELLELLEANEELFAACIVAAKRLVPADKLMPSHVEVAGLLYGSTMRRYYGAKDGTKGS